MAFSLSPDVSVQEKDLTLFTRTIVTNSGGFAGTFRWGPVEELYHITNGEDELVSVFAKPDNTLYLDFMCAAGYLAYSNSLYVSRSVGPAAKNAYVDDGTAISAPLVENEDSYNSQVLTNAVFAAKYPGTIANGLKYSAVTANDFDSWAYKSYFSYKPTGSEFHAVIIDVNGSFEAAGTILEKFEHVSPTAGVKHLDGTSAYYVDVLNTSKYVWVGAAAATEYYDAAALLELTLAGGVDDDANAIVANGYALFQNPEDVSISFIIGGACDATIAGTIIDYAESRKDCFAFISPLSSDVVNNKGGEEAAILTFRNTEVNKNSSYGVLDCNWKYTYDRYNGVYRWVPCNPDVAGLLAQTYANNDPWMSPAGYNRGQLKNVVKLAWNPSKANRDVLYTAQVNPIVSFPGEGIVLFGDKTMLDKPSAFGYINVRSLFIILEKSIADAAKYQLFELNNNATRAQFTNATTQFLRDIKGRGGVYDFQVVADTTVNTAQVIDEGRFVGVIKVKPARSINNMELTFAAVGTGVDFTETESA